MRTQNRSYKTGALQLNVLKQTLQSGKRVDAADLIEYAARLDGEYRNSRTAPLADIYREYPPRLTLQSYADFLGDLTQLSHEERKSRVRHEERAGVAQGENTVRACWATSLRRVGCCARWRKRARG